MMETRVFVVTDPGEHCRACRGRGEIRDAYYRVSMTCDFCGGSGSQSLVLVSDDNTPIHPDDTLTADQRRDIDRARWDDE
ncbi:hypothetical protein [Maritimibacter sp. DP1N21-5]|uniref:hypothetical protein n=1 Tax=Maritimibacter sp. DP1N21-5 TaxID=2836867 RepID=UPI001C47B0C3|nr:hypothetical protein [Maritimibacter sp. DP1N21-5]MBV7408736.1 hypothetical protein [Maritimibacter sp. DP1N21-5]